MKVFEHGSEESMITAFKGFGKTVKYVELLKELFGLKLKLFGLWDECIAHGLYERLNIGLYSICRPYKGTKHGSDSQDNMVRSLLKRNEAVQNTKLVPVHIYLRNESALYNGWLDSALSVPSKSLPPVVLDSGGSFSEYTTPLVSFQ